MNEPLSQTHDECVELALRAGQGSEEALAALEKHPVFWERVLRIIRQECKDRPDFEDQVEEQFYKRLPRKIRNFKSREDGKPDNLWAWLRIVIRRIRLGIHRRFKRFSHDSVEDHTNLIDDQTDQCQKLIINEAISESLTPKERRAFELNVSGGLTLKETATLLGLKSPTSVRRLVQIAKRKLRAALAGESFRCPPNQIKSRGIEF